jgi:hypothetical protein
MTYLLVPQHVSGIIAPIIRRTVQSRQRLWCTALAVLQQTRGEEVVRCAIVGIGKFTVYLLSLFRYSTRFTGLCA